MDSTLIITGIVSTVVGGIILYGITKLTNIPRRLYERIKKVSIRRKLLIKILPEGKITIPVDGRNLNIMIWNKNKFDIECEVELKFPSEIIEIYLTFRRSPSMFHNFY